MKKALSIVALILLALILPFFITGIGKQDGVDPDKNLPWQISVDEAGQSTVFGLSPGRSTVADVKRAFGPEIDVAIIAAPNETGAVEGYYAQVPLGFVLARVIVTVDVPEGGVAAMRARAVKAQHMESTTRKITLDPADLALIDGLPVRAISVIPNVNLDEATVVQRFGPPEERLAVSEKRTHLLYAKRGLDVVVDSDGKELLQYVAPRDFARLRAPLDAPAAGASAR